MGQATVDLPDPLESPPVSPASTDDLLAKLAGEEIERMLTESDEQGAETPSARSPAPVAPAKAPAPAQTESAPAVSATAAAPPAAAASAPPRTNDRELDALFTQLQEADQGKQEPAAAKAAEPAKADPLAKVESSATAAPSVAEELEKEMAEDAALTRQSPARLDADPGRASNDPLVLRILAWLNSPLDSFPDRVRDLVGKIAILTTVNAISILVYVRFFRHH